MATPLRVVCQQCKKSYRVKSIIPGKMPPCSACGGALALPAPLALVCTNCGARTKPAQVSLTATVPCPRCKTPLSATLPAVNHPKQSATPAAWDNINPESATVQIAPSQPAGLGTPVPNSEDATQYDPSAAEQRASGSLNIAPENSGPGGLRKSKFGRYEIIEEIARGGMGIVYRAHDPNLKRVVALKILIAGEGATEDSIKRFLREARAAGRLKHPNVVPVHEVGEIEGQYYFTMDFIDGKDLSDVVAEGNRSLRELLEALYEITKALQEAHDAGIIHRDLKPQNILIDSTGRALLTDFGLAKDLTSQSIQSITGAVFGTPAYMSPEQAQGKTREIDRRTDVYALGVILYELATGEKPFGGETLFDTIQAVVSQDPEEPRALRPNINGDLNTIILKCIEKDPARRYQNMRALAKDLASYLDGKPIKARPRSAPERLYRRIRKNRSASLTALAIPLALTVALVTWWLFGGGGFLATMQQEIESGDANRIASALVAIEGQFTDGKIEADEDIQNALALARSVLGGSSAEAEATALRLALAHNDGEAAQSLAEGIRDTALAPPRRTALAKGLQTLGKKSVHDPDGIVNAVLPVYETPDENQNVRQSLSGMLGAFWCIKSADALRRTALDTSAPQGVRLSAIHAIQPHTRLGGDEMKALIALQADEDELIASTAETALTEARTKTSIFSFYGLHASAGKAFEGVAKIEQMNAERNRQMMDMTNDIFGDAPAKKPKQQNPVAEIAKRLTDKDSDVRAAAAFDLGTLADPDGLSILVKTLSDRNASVRRAAARGIIKVIAKHPATPAPRKPVETLLEATDPSVRENAAWLLGKLESAESVPALLNALKTESDRRGKRTMIRALSSTGDTGALAGIRTVFDKTAATDSRLAAECITAMVPFGRAAVPHLIESLGHSSKNVRETAHAGLQEITGEDHNFDAARWMKWLDKK